MSVCDIYLDNDLEVSSECMRHLPGHVRCWAALCAVPVAACVIAAGSLVSRQEETLPS